MDAVWSFTNWIKRIPGFRGALTVRNQKKAEMMSAKIGEYIKIVIKRV